MLQYKYTKTKRTMSMSKQFEGLMLWRLISNLFENHTAIPSNQGASKHGGAVNQFPE